MDPEPDEEIAALVGDLVQAARVPAKRRPFSVKPTVERLTALAYEHGLRPDVLRLLVVDVLAAPGVLLDQASLGSLIRNLYPSAAVADDVVLAIVGCLGQGQLKPPLPVQALLLRWLVLVYHVLAPPALAVLSRAYAVLFNLLDTAGIRPQLCHVLVLITRRKHVRPFRIQAALGLSRQIGHDPHVVGLLRVFKNYYPEVIVGAATRGRASPFKHPDPQWRAHLDDIRLTRQQSRQDDANGRNSGANGVDLLDDAPYNGFRVRHDHAGRGRSAGKASGPPVVTTIHAQEESVTLEEIDSAAGLAAHFETIELPAQLVAVLADPLLQKLLQLRPADEAFKRVDNWLEACVASTASGDSSRDELMDLLEVVHDYITSTKTFPPIFHRFFREILAHWNGRDKKSYILESLAFVPVTSFPETYKATYELLEARLLNNDVSSQLDLLAFYTLVLRQWRITLMAGTDDDVSNKVAGSVAALVEHVSGLVLALIQNSVGASPSAPNNGGVSTIALLGVLDFYEEVTAVLAHRRDDVLASVQELIPPPAAVYTLHFHQSAAVVSRLYGLLANYKRGLEAAMSRRPGRSAAAAALALNNSNNDGQPPKPLSLPLSDHERARVNLFNGYLMDVCNCLWRSRAFSSTDTNALGCCVDGAVVGRLAGYVQSLLDRDLPLAAAFSLLHSPTFCLQAISYLRQLEDEAMEAASNVGSGSGDSGSNNPAPLQRRHAGPVTQAALLRLANSGGLRITWQAYRSGLLVYLEKQHLNGVASLMYNTMKNLMNARASSGG
ncbi:hypothetical protein HMPREF1624_01172 [Sporothrix schenckii ATCC 58251]|uniref:Centromere protein I n=1 Tax=Sporothrix schenckii (strain ATCC 58251 / de Perez 2211183) TaxID=1391915 RepID=U7Q4P9_SPOS1|nr:hypothetical protein HMPREF1624_01172 [Sporothrix schenckii ATCC 58251]